MTLDNDMKVLFEAISKPSTVTLIYDKGDDETYYPRLIEPYAVYPSKKGGVNLDVFQWSGDSDTKKQWKFKTLSMTKCTTIRFKAKIKSPHLRQGYKPDSARYEFAMIQR